MPTDPQAHRTTLFCLHFLGGSRRSWSAVADRLQPELRVVPIDLPGFGDMADVDAQDVSAMADHVAAAIRAEAPHRFVLAGHSMGAKVAAVLARRAADGAFGLEGLDGLVLVAGSPPSPEPIPPDRRRAMLSWFDAAAPEEQRRTEADGFIAASVGAALPSVTHALAVADVLRTDPRAWRAWLTGGSNEDWAAFVGVLRLPALIVAGSRDADLGPDAQASLVAPHFARAERLVLDGAGHLLPLERAHALADAIGRFVAGLPDAAPTAVAMPTVPDAYRRLIESDRVSTGTRAVLLERLAADGDGPAAPRALTPAVFAILRAVVSRVLPQDDASPPIDLARRIDATLAADGGDGWRFETMPPDREAMRRGLLTLDGAARAGEGGRPFVVLDGARQDALLAAAASGTIAPAGALDALQMTRWFEEFRALAVRAWIPHPATLARLGHSGIAYGGDGPEKPGFRTIGLGEREDWEPVAAVDQVDGDATATATAR